MSPAPGLGRPVRQPVTTTKRPQGGISRGKGRSGSGRQLIKRQSSRGVDDALHGMLQRMNSMRAQAPSNAVDTSITTSNASGLASAPPAESADATSSSGLVSFEAMNPLFKHEGLDGLEMQPPSPETKQEFQGCCGRMKKFFSRGLSKMRSGVQLVKKRYQKTKMGQRNMQLSAFSSRIDHRIGMLDDQYGVSSSKEESKEAEKTTSKLLFKNHGWKVAVGVTAALLLTGLTVVASYLKPAFIDRFRKLHKVKKRQQKLKSGASTLKKWQPKGAQQNIRISHRIKGFFTLTSPAVLKRRENLSDLKNLAKLTNLQSRSKNPEMDGLLDVLKLDGQVKEGAEGFAEVRAAVLKLIPGAKIKSPEDLKKFGVKLKEPSSTASFGSTREKYTKVKIDLDQLAQHISVSTDDIRETIIQPQTETRLAALDQLMSYDSGKLDVKKTSLKLAMKAQAGGLVDKFTIGAGVGDAFQIEENIIHVHDRADRLAAFEARTDAFLSSPELEGSDDPAMADLKRSVEKLQFTKLKRGQAKSRKQQRREKILVGTAALKLGNIPIGQVVRGVLSAANEIKFQFQLAKTKQAAQGGFGKGKAKPAQEAFSHLKTIFQSGNPEKREFALKSMNTLFDLSSEQSQMLFSTDLVETGMFKLDIGHAVK